jgi:hypothetical protein
VEAEGLTRASLAQVPDPCLLAPGDRQLRPGGEHRHRGVQGHGRLQPAQRRASLRPGRCPAPARAELSAGIDAPGTTASIKGWSKEELRLVRPYLASPSLRELPFRWDVAEDVELPWRERDGTRDGLTRPLPAKVSGGPASHAVKVGGELSSGKRRQCGEWEVQRVGHHAADLL